MVIASLRRGGESVMQKGALIKQVARVTTLHEEFVGRVINTTLKEIEEALWRGENIILPGFGTFYLSKRGKGKVTDRQGNVHEYGARKLAGFRAGPLLKREVREDKRRGGTKK
jgi:DNA-binding protein HU-beta